MGPLSDDEVIKAISTQCVPVALNREWISEVKGPVGDLYRSIQKQRPDQYQGIYVIDPEGKVLANQAREPKDETAWAKDLLRVIDAGVKAYGKVTPRLAGRLTALADLGKGEREDGSIALAVYARWMQLGLDRRGFGDPTYDRVVLTAAQRSSLALGRSKPGTTWAVPPSVVRRLHKVLSPSSDPNTMARADEVTRATLEGSVEGVRDGVSYLRFTGRIAGAHVWQFPPDKGKKIYSAVKLTGVGRCDANTGALLSITLVGTGTYRSYPPYDELSHYGAVIEWRAKR